MIPALILLSAVSTAVSQPENDTYFIGGIDPSAACLLASGTNSYLPLRINIPPYHTGRLRSPNFGQGRFYPPNSLCRWTIAAPNGYVIFVNITTLRIDTTAPPTGSRSRNPPSQSGRLTGINMASDNIIRVQPFGPGRSSVLLPSSDIVSNEAASGCEGDYLEVLDGTDYRQRHQLIGRYCSDSTPRPIVSVYNEVQIVFQSDGFKEDVGFELEYTAVSPHDIAIGRDGRLHVQSMEKDFAELDESHSDDNEIISARNNYELLDFPVSGPSSDNAIMRPSSNLFLYGGDPKNRAAKSRSSGRAGADDNMCSRGAAILTANQGHLTSPNFGRGQYPPGSHCEWLITAPRDRVVLLQFDELRLEYGLETRGCTFDYVEIFDGRDPTAPVLGRYCGRALPKVPIRSSSNYLFVVFQSDLSREDYGFSANYQIVSASPGCDGTVLELKGKSGEIMSPNFGLGPYPSNSECRWIIRVPDTFFVSLAFIDFDIESHAQQPSFGNGLNSPNGIHSNNNNGNHHRRCSYDFLEIFDGTSPDDSQSYGRYCGTAVGQQPPTIRSTQNTMSLVFRTDFSGERRGFRLQFAAVLPFPGCEGKPHVLRERSGEISSPNFGQDAYPPNSKCTWIVDPNLDRQMLITVSFMHFQVEGRYASTKGQVTCPYDFVEIGLALPHETYEAELGRPSETSSDDRFGGSEVINEGEDISSVIGVGGRRRFCGQSLPAPFTVRGRRLRVRFHSDFNKQDAGFWLRYEIHDPATLTTSEPDPVSFMQGFKNKFNRRKTVEHSNQFMNILLANSKAPRRTTTVQPEEIVTEPPTTQTEAPPTTTTTTELPSPATEPKPEPETTLFIIETTSTTQEVETSTPSTTTTSTTTTEAVEITTTTTEETVTVPTIGSTEIFSVMTSAAVEKETTVHQHQHHHPEKGGVSKESKSLESGEFMLVVDEDLTDEKHDHHVETPVVHIETSDTREQDVPKTVTTVPLQEATITAAEETPEQATFGGIVIDESFMSGDGEYALVGVDELINGEDGQQQQQMMESSSSDERLNLKAILFDRLPAEASPFGELVPLDPVVLEQPSVNVTLLSLFDTGNNQQDHDSSASTEQHNI